MAGDRIAIRVLESPLGPLRIAATQRGIVKLSFPHGPRTDFNAWLQARIGEAERVDDLPGLACAVDQVRAYFDGSLRDFKVDLDLRGSSFQVEVWRTLAEIPYGKTWTYAAVAERVGRPRALRAVGAAAGANPVPLILPCHRVTAAGGRLGGFGGGLDAKRRLLAFESQSLPLLSRSARSGV